MQKKYLLLIIGLSLALLSACGLPGGGRPGFEDRVSREDLNSLTGTLEALPQIDIYQGGTHLLRQTGGRTARLQSADINLNRYLEQEVTLYGNFSDPIGNAEPVFSVAEVQRQADMPEGEIRPYENVQAGFRFDYPAVWELKASADRVELQAGGKTAVAVAIIFTELSLDDFIAGREMEPGDEVTVGTQRAQRYRAEDQTDLYLKNPSKNKLYHIHFAPTAPDRREEQEALFLKMLETFTPLYSARPTGKRCGGPADLQCPEGYRCELSSAAKNAAGVCVAPSAADETACPFIPEPDCTSYEAVQFGPSGCPTRYECTDALKEEEDNPIRSEKVTDVITKYRGQLLGSRSTAILRYEISAESRLVAVIYREGEKTLKTLFRYEPSGNEFNFEPQARFESDGGDGWTVLSGQDLQSGLPREILYENSP